MRCHGASPTATTCTGTARSPACTASKPNLDDVLVGLGSHTYRRYGGERSREQLRLIADTLQPQGSPNSSLVEVDVSEVQGVLGRAERR